MLGTRTSFLCMGQNKQGTRPCEIHRIVNDIEALMAASSFLALLVLSSLGGADAATVLSERAAAEANPIRKVVTMFHGVP